MPGIILMILDLPPLVQIVPVKGSREISVIVHHQHQKYNTGSQCEPEQSILLLFSRNHQALPLPQLQSGTFVYTPFQSQIYQGTAATSAAESSLSSISISIGTVAIICGSSHKRNTDSRLPLRSEVPASPARLFSAPYTMHLLFLSHYTFFNLPIYRLQAVFY